ncbi:hypothetical protein [Streptomyces sp. NPDC020141]|uniref:hypothetical protein n=1 Tax=Streptomyces sp. NPDC020141 TaxID=3365065 RepID=UPI0037A568D4
MTAAAHLLLSALTTQALGAEQTASPRQRPRKPARRPGEAASRAARSGGAPRAPWATGPAGGYAPFIAEPTASGPLTSEPPLPDAAPLTSEPPLADTAPLTSEPTAAGFAGDPQSPGV